MSLPYMLFKKINRGSTEALSLRLFVLGDVCVFVLGDVYVFVLGGDCVFVFGDDCVFVLGLILKVLLE